MKNERCNLRKGWKPDNVAPQRGASFPLTSEGNSVAVAATDLSTEMKCRRNMEKPTSATKRIYIGKESISYIKS